MPEALDGFLDRIADFDGINPLGLMTIAPKCYEKDDYRIFFAETYQILLDINAKKMHNRCVPLLSMGMSDSFELALEYGANVIRTPVRQYSASEMPTGRAGLDYFNWYYQNKNK